MYIVKQDFLIRSYVLCWEEGVQIFSICIFFCVFIFINYATLFPMRWGWGGFAVKGIMQINMKIKYSQDKIFPLVAENKSSPFPFFRWISSPSKYCIRMFNLSFLVTWNILDWKRLTSFNYVYIYSARKRKTTNSLYFYRCQIKLDYGERERERERVV